MPPISDDEKKAWEVFLTNRLNPRLWKFLKRVTHDHCGATMNEFKNIETGDFISIEHVESKKKQKGRLYK